MRIYPVPFSAQEEEKLIFNLSAREVLVMSIDIGAGLIMAGILARALHTFMLYCIPVAIPFVIAAFILAFTKITRSGCQLTLDEYVRRLIKYNRRPRHYLRYRERSNI
jgi:uncharacterized protein YacL